MTEAAKNVTILDLDALMDTKLDDVKTIPDFMNPPAGQYRLSVFKAEIEKYESKEKPAQGGKPAQPAAKRTRIKVIYSVVATKELSKDADEPPVADGTMFNETFMGTEQGLEFFKKRAIGVTGVAEFGDAKLRDILDGMVGIEFDANIKYRTSKMDDGKEYENIQIRVVREAA